MATGTTYSVSLVTTRGERRPIVPDKPFTDLESASAWARSKMRDPRYASWLVEEIIRTGRAAMNRGTVATGSR